MGKICDMGKKEARRYFRKNKNQKLKYRKKICRKISEKIKATSTKFPSYRPVGALPYTMYA
jgi:hypothetical protein